MMIKKILYYIVLIVLIFYILIYLIGLRGVSVDPWLTEVEKNKFLFEYTITCILLILFLITIIFVKKRFK